MVLKDYKAQAYNCFHERFSKTLLDMGFVQKETGYYLPQVEKGYILNMCLHASPFGDSCYAHIGFQITTDHHLFLKRLYREDEPDRLWNVAQHFLNDAFYGWDKEMTGNGKLEETIDAMYAGFVEKIQPIWASIHDEKSCYKAMILTDRIFPTKIARNYVYAAINAGYVKRAMRRIRAIRPRKWEVLYSYADEYFKVLELLENDRLDEVQHIIKSNQEDAKRRYYECIKRWGYER